MTDSFDQRLEKYLQDLEVGRLDVLDQLEAIHTSLPLTYAYLFAEDTKYLVPAEQEQYVLLITLLWLLQSVDQQSIEDLTQEEIEGIEDLALIWASLDENAVAAAAQEAKINMPIEIIQLINDLADPDLAPTLTDAGCDWIFTKGSTFYMILQELTSSQKK